MSGVTFTSLLGTFLAPSPGSLWPAIHMKSRLFVEPTVVRPCYPGYASTSPARWLDLRPAEVDQRPEADLRLLDPRHHREQLAPHV